MQTSFCCKGMARYFFDLRKYRGFGVSGTCPFLFSLSGHCIAVSDNETNLHKKDPDHPESNYNLFDIDSVRAIIRFKVRTFRIIRRQKSGELNLAQSSAKFSSPAPGNIVRYFRKIAAAL